MPKRKSSQLAASCASSSPARKVPRTGTTDARSDVNPSAKPDQAARKPHSNVPDDHIHHETPSETQVHQSDNTTSSGFLQVVEENGDIFVAPPNSVLIHACNCEGLWGAGIAKAFKDHYPKAYQIYHAYCVKTDPADLPGTAFLIPPQSDSHDPDEVSARHFIGCLFTSRGKGRTKDSPTKILANTGPAVRDLLNQIAEWNADEPLSLPAGDISMCKINSGLFRVPWGKTKTVLEAIEVDHDLVITVVEKG